MTFDIPGPLTIDSFCQFREIEKEEAMHKLQMLMPPSYPWAAHSTMYCPSSMGSCSPPPPVAYYSVGYPQHDDNIGKYKNVVKELEDAKL